MPFCSLRWDAPHGPVTGPVTPQCPLMTPADSKLDQNRCRVQIFRKVRIDPKEKGMGKSCGPGHGIELIRGDGDGMGLAVG